MTACAAVQPLLLDRAAGALPPAAARELEAHLAGCAACRAEAAALEETVALVRLPPPTAGELAALDGLAATLVSARQAGRARASGWKRAGAGLAVAAALLVALALPALWRKAPVLTTAEQAAWEGEGAARWDPPDPDELAAVASATWPDETSGGTTSAAAEEEDVLLGAAEEWSRLFPAAE